MLGKNIEVRININSDKETFKKCCEDISVFLTNKDINIILYNNNPHISLSFTCLKYDKKGIEEFFNPVKIKLTNGLKFLDAYIFKKLSLIIANSFYGTCDFSENKDTYKITIPGNVTMSLSQVPNEYNTFFYFTTFPFLENTLGMYRFNTGRAFKCEGLKAFTYIVSKNCCSSIINLFYNTDISSVDSKWFPWDIINTKNIYKSSLFVPESQISEKKHEKYRKFIILRDPIERFVSIVNYAKGRWNHAGQPYIYPYMYSKNKSKVIDVVIAIIKGLNALDNIYFHDDHFMSQSQHLKNVNLMEIDDIVLNKDINSYFQCVFNVDLPKVNECQERFISIEDLSEKHINEIKSLFKDDYAILNHVKLWKK